MVLTDTECKRAAYPEGKTQARFRDSGGLYLEVAPNGSKRWFWKYYLAGGTEKRLALDSYPAVSIKAARVARDEARLQQQKGVDPGQQRRLDHLAKHVSTEASFEAVVRELHAKKLHGW